MLYFKRNPFLLRQWRKKDMLWQVPNCKNAVYLTFDDGPTPELTLPILNLLKNYNAKATFFCVGENVALYPELYQQIIDAGHGIGNHTYNHLNAWETENEAYVNNVDKASMKIASKWFRPPYGKITPKLVELLKDKYSLVMWTVLSGDFDQEISSEQCFINATSQTEAGDIIVFHDNLKAKKHVLDALPKTLEFFHKKGLKVSALPDNLKDL